MKAFIAEADWAPRAGYKPTEKEQATRWAVSGSLLYKNPKLHMVERERPTPAHDELLLRVRYCGICGSDVHVYETDAEGYVIFSGPTKLPCVLGHEYSAEVVDMGRDVSGFEKGDLVTGESVLWCGKCEPCRRGMVNQCKSVELMGLTVDGAFADYITMPARFCWKLNGLVSRMGEDAALKVGSLVEPVGCAYNGIYISSTGVVPGDTAVVYGAGPIGLGAIALLRATGASRVVAVDVVPERRALATKLGADAVFDGRMDNLRAALEDALGGLKADIQVEAAGVPDITMPLMQDMAAPRGRMIYLGRAGTLAKVDLNRIVSGAHSIIGSRGHSGYGIFANIIRLMEGGRLDALSEIVTSVYPLDKIGEAFDASRSRTDGKILIGI